MNNDQDVRPQTFDTYVGQRAAVDVLRRAVVGARAGGRPCGHVLLDGGAGCGKTSLAQVVANEMGSRFTATVCTAIEHRGELTAMLTSLAAGDVLFLDEIHALDKKAQEMLYMAAEDGVIDVSAGRRMIRLPLQPFTLVGATTRTHLLTGPLRDRFRYTFHLGHYSVVDLATIALGTARRLGLAITPGADALIGRSSRGVPRVANRRVLTCRDFMESAGLAAIDEQVVRATLDALGVDDLGLDGQDRAYLRVLAERTAPTGLAAIAAQMGVEAGVLEGTVEPYLTEVGFVRRAASGRTITAGGLAHLAGNPEVTHGRGGQPIAEDKLS